MGSKGKRPAPLDLSRVQGSLSSMQSSPRMSSFALTPEDKHHVLQQSREIALQQKQLMHMARKRNLGGDDDDDTNNDENNTVKNSVSENSKDSVDDHHTNNIQDPKIGIKKTNQGKSKGDINHNDIENNHNGPGMLPLRKRMCRNSPPCPLHLPLRILRPLRSAPADGRHYWTNASRVQVPLHALSTPAGMTRYPRMPIMYTAGGKGHARLQYGGYPMMMPVMQGAPMIVKSGMMQQGKSDKSTSIDDVYAGSYSKKNVTSDDETKEGSDKGKQIQNEIDADDDVESKAIEEGAKTSPEDIRGTLKIGEMIYNYSVSISGHPEDDKKHFHDVMDIIWKNYCKA